MRCLVYRESLPFVALVVGVDEYSDHGPNHLRGCVNDTNSFIDYLLHRFKPDNPAHCIKHLTNCEATREKVLSAFEDHLINNDRVEKGAPIIFYFAGHGGRQKTNRKGWVSHQSKVEVICPYDVKSEHGIPDYTLAALLRRLEYARGKNIVSPNPIKGA
jgi:uncharacterized caspase-like protein